MGPIVIEDTNLSYAWRRSLEHAVSSPKKEITPLLVSLTSFDEDEKIRNLLDSYLKKDKMGTIQTVSDTIFPSGLNKFCKSRHELYQNYLEILPRLKNIEKKGNGRGTYFERFIAYDSGMERINQLEIIITSLKNKNVRRRSKLQASIFDPRVDHINGMFQGFPCLQHVSFFRTADGGLVINSFYAIQFLYRRAYGNWLGLINLGKFVAKELNLELERFNCYVGVEHLDKLTMAEARALLSKI